MTFRCRRPRGPWRTVPGLPLGADIPRPSQIAYRRSTARQGSWCEICHTRCWRRSGGKPPFLLRQLGNASCTGPGDSLARARGGVSPRPARAFSSGGWRRRPDGSRNDTSLVRIDSTCRLIKILLQHFDPAGNGGKPWSFPVSDAQPQNPACPPSPILPMSTAPPCNTILMSKRWANSSYSPTAFTLPDRAAITSGDAALTA